ncbi:MAG: gibberellin regulated protein [Prochlorococcus marinus CUG1439]|uniref:gibberellin regulated protein n=1 Tax=Prochlorococcus sp. MIT 1314 TaxID=3096220 RepID=UPI002A628BB6|nr:gibberellin regulated protein [Prochlorococcus sp. MIT 1314]MCR8540548.1 gibberellin regulated protein [Prochlorococcus marinus CUG1439]
MHIVLKKLQILIFFFFLALNFNHYSHAHLRGTFSSEQDAVNKSFEIGCEGIHKNKDKWLPCENEKELHKYLSK